MMNRSIMPLVWVFALGCSQAISPSGRSVSSLVEDLETGSTSDQVNAMHQLGALGKTAAPAVPRLVQALKDERYGTRKAAADSLSSIGKPAVPSLVRALLDQNEWSPGLAADILGTLGEDAAPAVAALTVAADKKHLAHRTSAIRALGDIGPDATFAIPKLIELLGDVSVARTAAESISKMGAATIPALYDVLKHPKPRVRLLAVGTLGEIGPPAVPALTAILKERVRYAAVADEAIRQLGQIGPPAREAIPFIVERFGYEKEEVRRVASFALAKIGPDSIPEVLAALDHRNFLVQATACETVGRLNPPPVEALDKLIDLLTHQNQNLRKYACRAIGAFGSDAEKAIPAVLTYLIESKSKNTQKRTLSAIGKPAVPFLIVALSNPDDKVRAAVADSLRTMGPEASDAVPALMGLFNDNSDYARGFAVIAIHGIGTGNHQACLPALVDVLRNDRDKRIRSNAARTIATVAQGNENAIAALTHALDDRESTVVLAALKGMKKINADPSHVVTSFANLLSHKDITIRINAANALGDLGPEADSAIPALIRASNDKYDKYGNAQKSAHRAIRKIATDSSNAR